MRSLLLRLIHTLYGHSMHNSHVMCGVWTYVMRPSGHRQSYREGKAIVQWSVNVQTDTSKWGHPMRTLTTLRRCYARPASRHRRL
jgi:hypothetical protein